MDCPHCRRDIAEAAKSCIYCGRTIKEEKEEEAPLLVGDLMARLLRPLRAFFLGGKALRPCPWTLLDAFAISILIVIFAMNDPFHLGSSLIKFLRLHFFIFTKEPKLLYYMTVYMDTVIMKFIIVVFLAALISSRKVSFWDTVVSSGDMPDNWNVLLPSFIVICVAFQFINKANPLVPNIPFNSVFLEAKILGNLVIVFSVLFVAPFVEEIIFRGFFYPALNRHMGIYPAIIVTSILFTLAHYPQVKEEYVFGAVIFVLSFLITYVRAKTGSTRIAIVMHHLYNLVCVGLGYVEYVILRY